MKVFVCGLHQESNSFNPKLAGFDSFHYIEGEEVITLGRDAGVTVFGMLNVLRENNITPVCGAVMRAGSGAPLKNDVAENFIKNTLFLDIGKQYSSGG